MAIRTLVVDDTILYRKIMADVAGAIPDIEVMGAAASGDIALKKLELTPADLVFCDVHMPGRNGVETLVEIRRRWPSTVVVMISGIDTRNAESTVKALELGALDFIAKPSDGTVEENTARLRRDMEAVIRLVKIRRNTAGGGRQETSRAPAVVAHTAHPRPSAPSGPTPSTFAILAIGVSTGGPEALNRLIPALPASLPVPVVLVQHMPPHFTLSLAQSLDKKSQVRVVEGSEDQVLAKGTVYIAPGGRHMTVRQKEDDVILGLNDGPPENSCRPAADVLFRSVANVYGNRGILAAVLTGMGSDGLNGVRTMKRNGCYCITQAAASCVVYGMPRAIDEAGLADTSLPLEEIPGEMCRKLGC